MHFKCLANYMFWYYWHEILNKLLFKTLNMISTEMFLYRQLRVPPCLSAFPPLKVLSLLNNFFSLLACNGAKLLLIQARRLKNFLSTNSHDSPEGFERLETRLRYINNYSFYNGYLNKFLLFQLLICTVLRYFFLLYLLI